MGIEIDPHPVEPGRDPGVDHRHRTNRPPDRAEPAKPRIAREIMGARKRHRRWRSEPRLELDPRTGGKPLGRVLLRQRNANARGQPGGCGGDRQSQIAFRGERLDQFDPTIDIGHLRMIEPWCGDHIRAQPDEAAAQCQRDPEPGQRAARPALPPCQPEHRGRCANAQQANPSLGIAKREPQGDTEPERCDKPQWQLPALSLEKSFEAVVEWAKPNRRKQPMRRFQRRVLHARGARPVHRPRQTRGKRA